MKNRKRYIALALAAATLLATVGCGNQAVEKEESTADSTQVSSESKASSEEQEEVNELAWLNSSDTLPLVQEGTKKTLSIYANVSNASVDPEDVWMYQFVEKEMNIDLEVTFMDGNNKTELISLAFASGDLPDIIIGGEFTANDLIRYGSVEGQIIDLAPYMETYMPNLTALLEKYPEFAAPITDGEGHVWSTGNINNPSGRGNIIRAFANYDWLETCSRELPTTLDEFLETLRAFKEMDPECTPLGGTNGWWSPGAYILNAFGYLTTDERGLSMAMRDGKPVLPVADREAYGAYLEFMKTLYEEGLIHPDFFTMSADSMKALKSEGKVGYMFQAPFLYMSDFSSWWGAEPLTSEYNDTKQWPAALSTSSLGKVVVTSSCEEPELAATFIDYFYDYDHYILSAVGPTTEQTEYHYEGFGDNFGWHFDDAYTRVLDEYELNKDKYSIKNDYLYKNIQLWANPSFGLTAVLDPDAFDPGTAGDPDTSMEDTSVLRKEITNGQKHFEIALQETMGEYVTTDLYPIAVYLDAATSEEMNNLLVVIQEYANQEAAKFITGARSLDELDAYFDEIEALGAAEYVQVYTDYYNSIQ